MKLQFLLAVVFAATFSSAGYSDEKTAFKTARHLIGVAGSLDSWELNLSTLKDPDFKNLSRLPEEIKFAGGVRRLYLANTAISDLSPLIENTELREINLRRTKISNLAPLTHLKKLTSLDLSETEIGDDDLSVISALTQLKSLSLKNTKVTDIAPLAKLKNLRYLNVVGLGYQDFGPLIELPLERVSHDPKPLPILEQIRKEGQVKCGATFGLKNVTGIKGDALKGFDVELCAAIATVLFGENTSSRRTWTVFSTTHDMQFQELSSGRYNVLLRAPYDLARYSELDLQQASVTYHDQVMAFVPKYIGGIYSLRDMSGATVCVMKGSFAENYLNSALDAWDADLSVKAFEQYEDLVQAYKTEACQSIVDEALALESIRSHALRKGEHQVLPDFLGEVVLGMATRQKDGDLSKVI